MKIRIIDLMDHYYGPGVKLDTPEALSQKASEPKHTAQPKARRIQKPLLIAASLVLIVTAGFAGSMVLSRTAGGNALSDDPEPMHALETFAPEETPADEAPAVISEDSSLENPVAAPQAEMSPQVIEGTLNDDYYYCNGNLIPVGDSYYTMTENGPELLEMQNLHTTVDFHGTWEVDIDYAVVDGELVFQNNTDRNSYTIVDGQKMNWVEYEQWKLAQMGISEDTDLSDWPMIDRNEVEWITPQVAIAEPLKGSADTIQLSVRRDDIEYIDNLTYPFFYNIFTGEITDPLASVPELFDQGGLGSVRFNDSLTRALVDCWPGNNGCVSYVCDFTTGEVQRITDLLEPYLPESEVDGTSWYENGGGPTWADDDTLLLWEIESVPNGKEPGITEDGDVIRGYDYHPWLFSYDVAAGSLKYKQRDVEMNTSILNYNQSYLHDFLYNKDSDAYSVFQVIDTASGACYVLDGLNLNTFSSDETSSRSVFYGGGPIYLVDDDQLGWVDLSAHMTLPSEDIQSIKFAANNWLYLTTAEHIYCYRIPEDLPMTPLTAK